MHFPPGSIAQERFFEVVRGCNGQRFKTDFSSNIATVYAATFSDLKRLSNMLAVCFGTYYTLIEPERQFLIEKGWNYFDSFDFDGGQPRPLGSFSFPDVRLEFLSEPLGKTVSDLLQSNRALAMEMASKVAYSRLAKIPLVGREEGKGLEEIFLENAYFAAGIPVPVGPLPESGSVQNLHGKSQIDLSAIVSLMSARPYNNISPETVNCPCCSPSSISDANVLTSSLVKVRFLREGFYFNSFSRVWAEKFHVCHADKGSREERRSEYCFGFYPVGPFSRGREEMVLLADALLLQAHDDVEILQEVSLSWFCTKRESALSNGINALHGSVSALTSALEQQRMQLVASKGLFFSQVIESDPGHYYRKVLAGSISKTLSSIPRLITDPKSRFFTPPAAIALECLSGSILRDFEGLVASSNSALRSSRSFSSVCVEPHSTMSLLRRFSELYNIESGLVDLRQPS